LKAQQQAKDAREKAKRTGEARAIRNRALVLLGVVLERAALDAPDLVNQIRALTKRHLSRESERAAALAFLDTLKPVEASMSTDAS
jgi:hypothetical protein